MHKLYNVSTLADLLNVQARPDQPDNAAPVYAIELTAEEMHRIKENDQTDSRSRELVAEFSNLLKEAMEENSQAFLSNKDAYIAIKIT